MKHAFWIYITLFTSLMACQSNDKQALDNKPEVKKLDTLKIALDWRPNILHSGIFLAQARSAYQEAGLLVEWFTPEVDNYQKKPILRLLDQEADLSMGPSEHLFYYAIDSSTGPKAEAIASLLSKPQSAFAVHADSDIQSPASWAQLQYIGYDTPLEEAIIQSMVENAGGRKMPEIVQPGRLAVWDAFLAEPRGIAWIFTHWEGQMSPKKLNFFSPNDWGVPYGYSSVIMARKNRDAKLDTLIQTFLTVTMAHYVELAQAKEKEKRSLCAELVEQVDHPNYSSPELILQTLEDIQHAFYAEQTDNWGRMDPTRWKAYLNWISENQLLDSVSEKIPAEAWYTHTFLDAAHEN
jgi:NitT/TauT family transport system substrate-binding protein